MKESELSHSIIDYLGSRDLSEHLKLTNELSFHWANWYQTCLAQRKHYKNFNNNYHLIRLNQALQELKLKPVWLCNKIKVIKSDIYSLYESYLDSRLRLTWFERKDEILFSLDSEHGPYFTLTSMKWFDPEVYSKFVMRKILLEHYTLRSFRLNANIPVILKMDNDVNEYKEKVVIQQLSEIGFIFKFKDKNFINKIKNSKSLELKIPINHYKNLELMNVESSYKKLEENSAVLASSFMQYKLEARILNLYGNMNNAKRSTEESFCIFAKYEDLVPTDHEVQLKNVFSPFVEKTKIYFANCLEDLEQSKIWKKCA